MFNNGVVCGAHLDSQYLFIERCDTSTLPHRAGERKKDEREKRTETGKRVTVNKWPAYLFGEKANSCTGQNADSMPMSPAVKARRIALRFPRFCLFLRTFLSFKIEASNQVSDVSPRLIYVYEFRAVVNLIYPQNIVHRFNAQNSAYSLSELITRGLVIHF